MARIMWIMVLATKIRRHQNWELHREPQSGNMDMDTLHDLKEKEEAVQCEYSDK